MFSLAKPIRPRILSHPGRLREREMRGRGNDPFCPSVIGRTAINAGLSN